MTGYDGSMLKIPLIPAVLIFMSIFNSMLKKGFITSGSGQHVQLDMALS